jgi:hypothetical protein
LGCRTFKHFVDQRPSVFISGKVLFSDAAEPCHLDRSRANAMT